MTIYFYAVNDPYGEFSNFSRHGFDLDGAYWPTSEHYFQAQKFVGTPHVEAIRGAKSPKDAARMGRDRKRPLRRDWESVKEEVMRRAVMKKFQTHADLLQLLLDTGEEELVEAAPNDYYWGSGQDGSGKNRLGVILMQVREALRS